METEKIARIFKALCDPKRVVVLEALREGELCACELQERLGCTQSGLSYHMKILCDSGLVTPRQEGKWTHYAISPAGRARALEALDEATAPSPRAREKKCCP